MKTLAQKKAFNALTYFAQHIKPINAKKAIKLLHVADQIAFGETGVPIIWIKDIPWKGYILDSEREFDDSQFCDYEIDIMELVINHYSKYSDEEVLHFETKLIQVLDADFKRVSYEVAYQSHLMEEN